MAFMGTVVTYGRGTLLVTDTGMKTQLGKIAELVQSVGRETTPLQRRLDQLGKIFCFGLTGDRCDCLFSWFAAWGIPPPDVYDCHQHGCCGCP